MSNSVIVHATLESSDDFRVHLIQGADPFGTPARVMVDIAPNVGVACSDPDVLAALAGRLRDAAELLLDSVRAAS